MPLQAHPHWRESSRWWAWSDDGCLLSQRRVVHRHGALVHAVDALVSPAGVEVAHRSGTGPGFVAPPVRGAAAVAGIARSSARQSRMDGSILARDLMLSAGSILPGGPLRFEGHTLDLDGWSGVVLTSSGIDVPDLAPGPQVRPLDALPQRFELMILVPAADGILLGLIEQDGSGATRVGQLQRVAAEPGDLALVAVDWDPGTRRARTVRLSGDHGEIVLRSVSVLAGSLVGGLGSTWPVDGWVGDAAHRRLRVPLGTSGRGLAGVQHEHLCAVEGIPGADRAILTVTALGAHGPSGLTGWTDPA